MTDFLFCLSENVFIFPYFWGDRSAGCRILGQNPIPWDSPLPCVACGRCWNTRPCSWWPRWASVFPSSQTCLVVAVPQGERCVPAGALLEFKPLRVLLAFLDLWFVFAINFEKLSAFSTSAEFSSFFCLLLTPASREVVSRFLDVL